MSLGGCPTGIGGIREVTMNNETQHLARRIRSMTTTGVHRRVFSSGSGAGFATKANRPLVVEGMVIDRTGDAG